MWSDYNCPKGFHIFDTDTRELERIENPLPIFKKLSYDDTKENYDNLDLSSYEKRGLEDLLSYCDEIHYMKEEIEEALEDTN